MKRKLIIDERIRKEEYNYLKKFFDVIKLPLSNDVYEEISGHSDIFYCKIDEKIICAPNAKIIDENFIIGSKEVKNKYPDDVIYNACQIGKWIIGSEYTEKNIPVNIRVRQGYTKCSISVTSDNSCITTDEWIAKKLRMHNVDALYIKEDNIKLLNKEGQESELKGFIGGASFTFDDKFVLFGDIDKLNNKEQIIRHLEKYNLKLIDFKNLEVYDYGGATNI